MDFLETNKDAIEQAIFDRVADLLNIDVEVTFYDTISLHFEISDEDVGDHDGTVKGSQTAGKKSYAPPRKRGHSKNGRSDAPQIVVGMAVTRDGFPVRHCVFPGNTVDFTTVARVKDDLRGWQLIVNDYFSGPRHRHSYDCPGVFSRLLTRDALAAINGLASN